MTHTNRLTSVAPRPVSAPDIRGTARLSPRPPSAGRALRWGWALGALAMLAGASASRSLENLRVLRGPVVCMEPGILWFDGEFDDRLGRLTAGAMRVESADRGLRFGETKKEDCAGFIYFKGSVKTTPKGLVYAAKAKLEFVVQTGFLRDIATTQGRVVSEGGQVMYPTIWSLESTLGIAANRNDLEKILSREAVNMFKVFVEDWYAQH